MTTAPALALHGVSFAYDSRPALFDIDLDVGAGELFALLGTNGAGKSTLLAVAAGLLPAGAGRVLLDGDDVTTFSARKRMRRGLALVAGGRATFAPLTVHETLTLSARVAGYHAGMVVAGEREIYATFPELERRRQTKAGALSRGEQQLLALAAAMIQRPRTMLIDELSLNLAGAVVERLATVVASVHAAGTAVVVADQSASLALGLAERACFLDAGRIRFVGPPAQLRERNDLLRPVFLARGADDVLA